MKAFKNPLFIFLALSIVRCDGTTYEDRQGSFIMQLIPLSQGKFAQVDDADFEWLNQWKWCALKNYNTYYALRRFEGRTAILMHRLILGLTDSKILGEHADRNGLNNQRYNIRACNNSENHKNVNARGASKYLGVHVHKSGSYVAKIVVEGTQRYLGIFQSETDAAKRYDEAAIMYHGQFANLNFKDVV